MKYTIALILILFINTSGKSQNKYVDDKTFSIGYKFNIGFIPMLNFDNSQLIKSHVRLSEITLGKLTSGGKQWHTIFNYPEVGLAFTYYNLMNDEELGRAGTVIPYLKFSIIRKPVFNLNFRAGLGLGYFNKTFDRTTNYKNTLIGRHICAASNFVLEANYRMHENIYLSAGLSASHASNAQTKIPNDGLNIIAGNIGAYYLFGNKPKVKYEHNKTEFDKTLKYTIIGTSGVKESVNHWSKKFLTLSMTGEISKQINQKQILGAGIDVFYDASFNIENKVQTGVHISHNVPISRFLIVVQMGAYTSNVIYDDHFFTKYGIRYLLNDYIVLNMTLKAHSFVEAHNLEWGIGYRF